MEDAPRDESVAEPEIGFSPRESGKRKAVDRSAYSILKEGEADILLQHGNDVFYNKAQIVNRDLSIAVLRAYAKKIQEEDIGKFKKKRKKMVGQGSADAHPRAEQVTGLSEDDRTQDELAIANSACNENHLVASVVDGDPLSTNDPQAGSSNASYYGPATGTSKSLHILEALSASGLRALRYAREVDGVGSVTALDNDKLAVEACKCNIRLNGSVAISKVQAVLADARVYMLTHEKQFDVVDIDPYGSPSVFLDSAVQSVADGGILMCTATDMAVLCGNNGEVCYSKYGSYPLRGKYCHEMALRILLSCIESHAIRYKRHVVPLLSISVDFYIRAFVRIFTSANVVKASPSKLSYIYQCVGCDAFHLQPVGRIVHKNNSDHYMPGIGPPILPDCRHCGKHFNMGGPIWSHPIHDPEWVSSILEGVVALKERYPAYDKIHSVLTSVSEELLDVPLYLSLHSLSATLKCTPPSASLFRYAIANAGFRISGTHAMALGLKTNAPMDVVWDIMRCWVKTHPVKSQLSETSGSVILSKEPTLEANFSKVQSALSKAQTKGVPRFLPNPEEFWGPKPRAGRQIIFKHAPLFGVTAINDILSQNDSKEESLEEIEAKRQKQEMA